MSRVQLILLAAVVALAPARAHAQSPPDLREAMQARDKAAAGKDAATWDRLTADDFTVVLEDGVFRSKAERLAHLKSQKPSPWVPPQQETIQRYGDVVIQRFRNGDTWALLVWVKDAKGWRVTAAQDTPAKK